MTRAFDHALNVIADIERMHSVYRFDAPIATEWLPKMREALAAADTEAFAESLAACSPETQGYIESALLKARVCERRAIVEQRQFDKWKRGHVAAQGALCDALDDWTGSYETWNVHAGY